MTQGTLFDLDLSEELKEEGMAAAARSKASLLDFARRIAVSVCLFKGRATSDDVGRILKKLGLSLGPAAGSLFKDSRFRFTGQRVKSARITNHARELKVWVLA